MSGHVSGPFIALELFDKFLLLNGDWTIGHFVTKAITRTLLLLKCHVPTVRSAEGLSQCSDESVVPFCSIICFHDQGLHKYYYEAANSQDHSTHIFYIFLSAMLNKTMAVNQIMEGLYENSKTMVQLNFICVTLNFSLRLSMHFREKLNNAVHSPFCISTVHF